MSLGVSIDEVWSSPTLLPQKPMKKSRDAVPITFGNQMGPVMRRPQIPPEHPPHRPPPQVGSSSSSPIMVREGFQSEREQQQGTPPNSAIPQPSDAELHMLIEIRQLKNTIDMMQRQQYLLQQQLTQCQSQTKLKETMANSPPSGSCSWFSGNGNQWPFVLLLIIIILLLLLVFMMYKTSSKINQLVQLPLINNTPPLIM